MLVVVASTNPVKVQVTNTKEWKIKGYDTFSMEEYDLPGEFETKEEAERAAQKRLEELEQSQPTIFSGGQDGVQDRVYIIKPDGGSYRYTP